MINNKKIGLLVDIENGNKELYDIFFLNEEEAYPRWLSCINSQEYYFEKYDQNKIYDFSLFNPMHVISVYAQTYLLICNGLVHGSISDQNEFEGLKHDAAIANGGITIIDLSDFPNAEINDIWNGSSFVSPS